MGWICKKCGGDDVEIKALYNLKHESLADFYTDIDEETWCNDCEGHTGIEYKN